MATIEELAQKVIAFRDARNWKQFHNPKDSALSLVLEAAEVMEHFQWKNEEEMRRHLEEKREEVGDELADTLYWLLVMAHDFEIDLSEAFERKLKKSGEKYPVEKSHGNHKKYTEF